MQSFSCLPIVFAWMQTLLNSDVPLWVQRLKRTCAWWAPNRKLIAKTLLLWSSLKYIHFANQKDWCYFTCHFRQVHLKKKKKQPRLEIHSWILIRQSNWEPPSPFSWNVAGPSAWRLRRLLGGLLSVKTEPAMVSVFLTEYLQYPLVFFKKIPAVCESKVFSQKAELTEVCRLVGAPALMSNGGRV